MSKQLAAKPKLLSRTEILDRLKNVKRLIFTIAAFKGGVGKTTTAIHLAAYLETLAPTLLVDGDANRSALKWGSAGNLPFKVVDEKQAVKFASDFQLIVVDTPARPSAEELETIAGGCHLLILPTTPEAMALDAMHQMVSDLKKLEAEYKILLTMIPPPPSKVGDEAREILVKKNLPLFKAEVKRLMVFQKASLERVPVNQVKDRYARIGWKGYEQMGVELLTEVLDG